MPQALDLSLCLHGEGGSDHYSWTQLEVSHLSAACADGRCSHSVPWHLLGAAHCDLKASVCLAWLPLPWSFGWREPAFLRAVLVYSGGQLLQHSVWDL